MQNKPYSLKDNSYVECEPNVQFIKSGQDILDIYGSMYPLGKLLIYQRNLNPDFFDLSTGLAGDILQKLVNYHIQTAFVIEYDSIKSERFKELMYETSTNNEYRFFESSDNARKWLVEE